MVSQTAGVRGEEEMRELFWNLRINPGVRAPGGARRGTWRTHSVTFYFKQVIRANSSAQGGGGGGCQGQVSAGGRRHSR